MQLCSGEFFVIQASIFVLKFMADCPSKSIFLCEFIGGTGLTFFVFEKCPHQPLTKLAAKTIMSNDLNRKPWLKQFGNCMP